MNKQGADKDIIYDSKYKNYVSQVEKALKAFESTSEWADLIASLGKLNKVLAAHSRYSIIPKKVLIGKRLAQCLHPALPSGVHLKTLETYDLIFKSIGTNELAADVFTYCSGLFPLLGYAAINVRPVLLQLYETYLLSLGPSVKPAMTGLIMGLLPGLENGSEFYDRTYQLLESFCGCVEKSYFYCCMWECVCVSALVRHAGLNYILMHFDKKQSMEDQIYLIGTSLDLLVQALCLSLEDSSSLVQRCVLDLMISCFPIHNCQLPKSDIMKVLMYAVTVLLRRDMSLNRRLYAWLMGTDINGMPVVFSQQSHSSREEGARKNQELNYFEMHSKEALLVAIKKILENNDDAGFKNTSLIPLKIIISLLDRPEIISAILTDLLLDILRCLYKECVTKLQENVKVLMKDKICFNDSLSDETLFRKVKNEEKVATTEIYKTANILFGKFDPHFIWSFIADLFESACVCSSEGCMLQKNVSIKEFCDIVNFILDKLYVEAYVEIQTEHFPRFLSHVMKILGNKGNDLPNSNVVFVLNLCLKMFSRTLSCFMAFFDCSNYSKHTSRDEVGKAVVKAEENDKEMSGIVSGIVDGENEVTKEFEFYGEVDPGTRNTPKVSEAVESNSYKTINKFGHTTMKCLSAQNCIFSFVREFLKFFQQALQKRILGSSFSEVPCMDYLFSFTNKDASWPSFKKIVGNQFACGSNMDSINQEELLKCACELLEKSLPFPGFDVSYDPSDDIPSWFQSLLMICVGTPFDFQYIALGCMFNLLEYWKCLDNVPRFSSERVSNNFCADYIQVLCDKTCFYKIIAYSIWKYMSDSGPRLSLKSVEIFNRIHQNAPHTWICEDVISREMLSADQNDRMKSSIQFITFWDSLKELGGRKTRQFEKSIMILLSNLDSSNYMFSSLSKSWITSCVKSADLVSILEPVLKVLLHPDTSRVSVQHMDSNRLRRQSSSFATDSFNDTSSHEAKIVAVSNEGGNIVYHIDNQNKYGSLRNLSPEEYQALALTTLSEQGSSTKRASILLDNFAATPHKVIQSNVTLRVNPFGMSNEENVELFPSATTDHHKIATQAKRLNMKTCVEEEICFDESQFLPDDDCIEIKKKIVSEIIDEILHNVVYNSTSIKANQQCNKNFVEQEISEQIGALDILDRDVLLAGLKKEGLPKKNIHSLRSYILLYIKKFDSSRILYALKLLKDVISTDPKLVVAYLLNMNLSTHVDKFENFHVIDLFLRHKQSIMGQSFHSNLLFDVADNVSGSSYLELVVFVLLYFIRSYFNQNLVQKFNADEVDRNKEVQISCCNILKILLCELTKLSQINAKASQNISNLLLKSKVQKTVLYSIYSSLVKSTSNPEKSLQKINLFRMYQSALLALTVSLVKLEDQIQTNKGEHNSDNLPKEFEQVKPWTDDTSTLKSDVVFLSGQPIVYQPIFLEAVIYSLKLFNDEQLHALWIDFIHILMPCLSKASTKILTCVILQLCSNMDKFEKSALNREIGQLSADYYIFLLKSVTSIYYHCLFDPVSSDYKAFGGQNTEVGKMLQSFSGQLMSGLANALSFQGTNKGRKFSNQEESSMRLDMCSNMVDLLPNISTSLLNAWKFSGQLDDLTEDKSPQMNFSWSSRVKQCVMNFLSPVANTFMHSLLASFALIWNEKFSFKSYEFMVDPVTSKDQLILVEILKEVKHISLSSLTISIKQMLKQPSIFSTFLNKCKFLSLEGGLLQMFYAYIKQLPDNLLVESVGLFNSFLRDCYLLNLDSSSVFVLISILHYVLQKGPMFEEKKEHKDIHDITHKLLESCSNIAGLSLEQAYFFRKYLAVKEDLTLEDPRTDDSQTAGEGQQLTESILGTSQQCKTVGTSTFSQSVQALHVLAEVTATLLDVVFQSDEKDKVTPLLNNILSNVFPYLRNHKLSNMPSFNASSKLIANLSSYQYTRRSWKKECFDLMLDPCFFLMDIQSLKYWIVIIDNLMAHDKSTFLDLLARFSLAQSSSLNLFGSRDAESEMKTQLLKKLSFTIFCSETDQYHKHMPEIQEKLFDCLRSHNTPRLHAEVFSCFRVLVLRMSSYCLTSLWPTMTTELIQVFINMERKLTTELEDTPRAYKTTDSLVNAGCERNCSLFLAACKLLDLFLALPSESLPQFQLYKWAFVADSHTAQPLEFNSRVKENGFGFVPHALKIAKQMHLKFGPVIPMTRITNRLIIHSNKISSLQELHAFFATICHDSIEMTQIRHEQMGYKTHGISKSQSYPNISLPNSKLANCSSVENLSPHQLIESIVLNDFLEQLS